MHMYLYVSAFICGHICICSSVYLYSWIYIYTYLHMFFIFKIDLFIFSSLYFNFSPFFKILNVSY